MRALAEQIALLQLDDLEISAAAIAENERGLGLIKKRNYKEAFDAFVQAYYLSPAYGEAHENAVFAARMAGDYQRAVDEGLAALATRPKNASTFRNLGESFARLDNFEMAVGCFQAAYFFSRSPAKTIKVLLDVARDRDPKVAAAAQTALRRLKAAYGADVPEDELKRWTSKGGPGDDQFESNENGAGIRSVSTKADVLELSDNDQRAAVRLIAPLVNALVVLEAVRRASDACGFELDDNATAEIRQQLVDSFQASKTEVRSRCYAYWPFEEPIKISASSEAESFVLDKALAEAGSSYGIFAFVGGLVGLGGTAGQVTPEGPKICRLLADYYSQKVEPTLQMNGERLRSEVGVPCEAPLFTKGQNDRRTPRDAPTPPDGGRIELPGEGKLKEAPRPITRVSPQYPLIAIEKEREGSVVLKVSINSKGMPTAVEVISEQPKGMFFGSSAVNAVSQWRWDVQGTYAVTVDFRLSN